MRAFLEVFQEDGELEFEKMVATPDSERQDVVSAGLVLRARMMSQSLLGYNKSLSLGVGEGRGLL